MIPVNGYTRFLCKCKNQDVWMIRSSSWSCGAMILTEIGFKSKLTIETWISWRRVTY